MNRTPWYLLLTVATLGLIAWAFGDALWHPNQYLFSHGGDMFKAYYAFDYYLAEDQGSWHTGFHYPYGNHLLYLDLNPLLAGLLKALQPWVDLSPYSVGLLNLLMMLSLLPCAWLVFALLRRVMLPPGYALPMALLITFLSPQIMRMTGAFALSFTFFVPLLWWLTLRLFEARQSWSWLLGYGLVVTLFAAMHPYHALLGAAWGGSYALFHHLQHQQLRRYRGTYLGMLLAAVLPGLLIKTWEALTWQGPDDFVTAPFGLFYYLAHPETVFLPFYAPFRDVWEFFINVKTVDHEGYAYVGLPGTLITLATLARVIKLVRQKRWARLRRPVLPDALRAAIWPAVLLLILAMGYPLLWMRGLEAYLGPLQQFRSLGRLAWFFYYVMMVFSAWWLYALYRLIRQRAPQTQLHRVWVGIILMAMLSWGLAAASLVRSQRAEFLGNPRSQFPEKQVDYRALLLQAGHEVEDFQAILTLPHFHLGSEKFSHSHWEASRAGMAVSAQTGLPLVNNLSARAPLTASIETLTLTAHPFLPRPLLDKLDDERPFLLVWTGEAFDPGELHAMAQAEWLTQTDFLHLARLEPPALRSDTAAQAQAYFAMVQDSLGRRGNFYGEYLAHVHLQTFDERPGYLGAGTVEATRPKGPIYRQELQELQPGQEMRLSFWMKIRRGNDYFPRSWLRQYRGDELLVNQRFEPSATKDVRGEWARVEVPFQAAASNLRLEVIMGGNHHHCDHFWVQPAGTQVFLSTENGLWLNNYPLE